MTCVHIATAIAISTHTGVYYKNRHLNEYNYSIRMCISNIHNCIIHAYIDIITLHKIDHSLVRQLFQSSSYIL